MLEEFKSLYLLTLKNKRLYDPACVYISECLWREQMYITKTIADNKSFLCFILSCKNIFEILIRLDINPLEFYDVFTNNLSYDKLDKYIWTRSCPSSVSLIDLKVNFIGALKEYFRDSPESKYMCCRFIEEAVIHSHLIRTVMYHDIKNKIGYLKTEKTKQSVDNILRTLL